MAALATFLSYSALGLCSAAGSGVLSLLDCLRQSLLYTQANLELSMQQRLTSLVQPSCLRLSSVATVAVAH